MIKYGDFEIWIGEPYPIFITIKNGGPDQFIRFQHSEIIDLEAAIKRIKKDCRYKLQPTHKREV